MFKGGWTKNGLPQLQCSEWTLQWTHLRAMASEGSPLTDFDFSVYGGIAWPCNLPLAP